MEKWKVSETRGIYFLRLIGRCFVLIAAVLLYIFNKDVFNCAAGMNFFDEFSPLHILWGIWVIDMILQLIPVKAHISIGSQKVFQSLFRPIKEKINYKTLKAYIKDTTSAAYKVMVIWLLLTGIVSVLYMKGIIDVGIIGVFVALQLPARRHRDGIPMADHLRHIHIPLEEGKFPGAV